MYFVINKAFLFAGALSQGVKGMTIPKGLPFAHFASLHPPNPAAKAIAEGNYNVSAGYDSSSPVQVTLNATNIFPNATANLTNFNINAIYENLNPAKLAWVKSLDPESAITIYEKARMMTEVIYAKPYDSNDPNMVMDFDDLIAAVMGYGSPVGNGTQLYSRGTESSQTDTERLPRDINTGNIPKDSKVDKLKREYHAGFRANKEHAVDWEICQDWFSCIAGSSCEPTAVIDKDPKAICNFIQNQTCCMSWSSHKVTPDLMIEASQECNALYEPEPGRKPTRRYMSCIGGGKDDDFGHSVCFSNRAKHCN